MKKILIAILIIILLVLSYVIFAKSINIGFIKVDSIKDIKAASSNLENKFEEANELSNKTYPNEVDNLENAIKSLKLSKQEYDNKKAYAKDDEEIGATQIKKYEIDYLWTVLGNYRKDRGVNVLNLDLKSTQTANTYDLEFTLIGSYVSITDFIYDIEDDEQLNFDIENFAVSSEITLGDDETQNNENNNNNEENDDANNQENTQNTNNENSDSEDEDTPKKTDGSILQATFTVRNVQILLDNNR